MPTNRHLDAGRRRHTYDRAFTAPVSDPKSAALRGCRRRNLTDDQTVTYLMLFERVREIALKGADTEPIVREFERLDNHMAVAAYHEAIASTRQPGWAE